MTGQIHKVVNIAIFPGKVEKFKKTASLFITCLRETEPDTMIYEWFLDEEQNTSYIIESYKDSQALLSHLANIRDLYEPFFEVAEITSIEVFGDSSEEVKQAQLAGTKFVSYWSGVLRQIVRIETPPVNLQ